MNSNIQNAKGRPYVNPRQWMLNRALDDQEIVRRESQKTDWRLYDITIESPQLVIKSKRLHELRAMLNKKLVQLPFFVIS